MASPSPSAGFDIVLLVVLVVAFLRGWRLFFSILALIVMVYLFRIFPNEILALIRGINELNGPAVEQPCADSMGLHVAAQQSVV